MSAILIRDLAHSSALDRRAMATVRGGNDRLKALGQLANVNVNVGVSQEIFQFQNVEVAAFNNVNIIGAELGPVHLNVSPRQWARATAVL